MMELCDRWPTAAAGGSGGVDEGNDGLDERIAQLDFEQSIDDQSLFSSLADATLISTDSLDLGTLRARCETNKADYKLTFEDSWTTSGFGTATSGGAQLEESAARAGRSADLLLNNADAPTVEEEEVDDGIGLAANGALTTWTRLRSAEPYDAKTNSMPSDSVAWRPSTTATATAGERVRRPTSLLANFVERQSLGRSTEPSRGVANVQPAGGDFDENENEIGFVAPPRSPVAVRAPIQPAVSSNDARRPPLAPPSPSCSAVAATPAVAATSTATASPADRWRAAHRTPQQPPRRTFAQLGVVGAAPIDLDFLALPYSMPNFCRSSPSLDELLKHTQRSAQSGVGRLSASKTEQLLSGCLDATAPRLPTSTSLIEDDPDSGISCGGISTVDGPAHIQDWPSLSMLLPRHVVDACSFFKANVGLLAGSSAQSSGVSSGGGGHHRPSRIACSVPSGVAVGSSPSSSSSPPPASSSALLDSLRVEHRPTRLRAAELRAVGLPAYEQKRRLVERVVASAARLARGDATAIDVCAALTAALSDGLRSGHSLWSAIVTLTAPGPATQPAFELVQRLAHATEKAENSRLLLFFKHLLKSHTLDGWLSYVVLKERALVVHFHDDAFMLRARTAYRSLFCRLVETLELLSVMDKCKSPDDRQPSPLVGDSRVPKSSSVPARLSTTILDGRSSLPTPTIEVSRPLGSARRRHKSRIPVATVSPAVSLRRRARSTHTIAPLAATATPTRPSPRVAI